MKKLIRNVAVIGAGLFLLMLPIGILLMQLFAPVVIGIFGVGCLCYVFWVGLDNI